MTTGVRDDRAGWMARRWTTWAVPLLVAVAVFIGRSWGLGEPGLANSEGSRVITAHQMVESGNWTTPRLYGRVNLWKPPLYYWVVGLTEKAAGRADEWVWRLPSVIEAVLVGAFLTVMARRWFGATAAVATAGAYMALIALIAEQTQAEIDGWNTAVATVCACAMIELITGRGRRWRWSLLSGVALGAVLLTKLHAGLSIVVGAALGLPAVSLAFALAARRRAGSMPPELARPWRAGTVAWVVLAGAIGVALFAGWVGALLADLSRSGLPGGYDEGMKEAVRRVAGPQVGKLLRTIGLPFTLFLYAFPASAALIFALSRAVRAGLPRRARRRLWALVGSYLVAMMLLVATGTENPRYAYVCLPILAPIAGGVVEGARRAVVPAWVRDGARWAVGASLACFALAPAILMAILLARSPGAATAASWLAAAVGVGVGAWWAWRRPGALSPAGTAAIAVLLVACPLGVHQFLNERQARGSGRAVAGELRAAMGDDRRAAADDLVISSTEVLYYAGIDGTWLTHPRGLLHAVERAGWVLFSGGEWDRLDPKERESLTRVQVLHWSNTRAVLAWYQPPAGSPGESGSGR